MQSRSQAIRLTGQHWSPDSSASLHSQTTDMGPYGTSASCCVCLHPTLHWYSLCLPTEGWPGWVNLDGWLHAQMV